MKRYIYLLERIRDSHDWPAGSRIWDNKPRKGWRVVDRILVE